MRDRAMRAMRAAIGASVLALPLACAAVTPTMLTQALIRDAVPPKWQGKAQVQLLDIPAEERSHGLVGAILVTIPETESHIRYFVFKARANAERGYRRYVEESWGGPMRRIAQEELTARNNGAAPGKVTCELSRNDSARLYVSACLHIHATLPVLTRGAQPFKFNEALKLGDPKMQRAREVAAAMEANELAGGGSLQVEKVARR